MILTSKRISELVASGDIVISPYNKCFLDVNSYSFHLSDDLVEYSNETIDPHDSAGCLNKNKINIPETGYILKPDHFYLSSTYEKMGSLKCASELYANLSTAACGMFIQTSAPLGHTGAIINWTLEIVVAQPIRVYPRMLIGKICFWENYGDIINYAGRYLNSKGAVASKIHQDFGDK